MMATRSNAIEPVDEFVSVTPKKGWFVSKTVVVLFAVGAVAVCAAVGVAVYFTHPALRMTGGGTTSLPRTSTLRPTTAPTVDPEQLWKVCLSMAAARQECLPGVPCQTTPSSTTPSPIPTTPPPTKATSVTINLRLPGNILPYHYNLRLRPDIYTGNPTTFSFDGHVKMFFNVANSTDVIVLLARNLTIDNSSIRVMSTDLLESVGVVNVEYEKESEFLNISMTKSLDVGRQYVVALSFSGAITDGLKGLYYSSYKLEGETKYLVASHLEPTEARKVFPCLDEPRFKATFNVTIERPANMTSWSNGVLLHSEAIGGGWAADYYSHTPIMSTYILAFVVADFKCRNATTAKGSLIEICARPNALQQMDLAVSVAGDIQEWFGTYFNSSYPLPKMVHLAVPDFGSGAMENWGLILYAEKALLFDPTTGTAATKQRVVEVIAHELAHQWFGKLVTMEWWNDIWLNEAFATYFERPPVSSIFPDWQQDNQFVTGTLQRALSFDSSTNSHPIVQDVNTPIEIKQMFDAVIYNKGGTILRMLKYLLGKDTFRAALSRYLADRAYKSATRADLYRAFTEQSRLDGKIIDIPKLMDTWILQMGYPVVRFDYRPSSGVLHLSQKHFLLDENANVTRSSPFNYTWMVPITHATDSSGIDDIPTVEWLDSSIGTLSVTKDAKWIIGNVRLQYPYRVTYNEETWRALIRQLSTNHEKIHIRSRAQLIDDVFQHGRAGVEDQRLALDVSQYIHKERDLVPWITWTKNIGYIDQLLTFTNDYQLFLKYVQRQIRPMFDIIQQSKDGSHIQRRLRSVVFNTACSFGLRRCLDSSSELFHAWMDARSQQDTTKPVTSSQPPDTAATTEDYVTPQSNDTNTHDQTQSVVINPIVPDIRSAVYCGAIRNGDRREWQFAFDMYKDPEVGLDTQNLIPALACSRDVWQLRGYLQMAIDEVHIRRQDVWTVFGSVAINPNGQQLAWDFFVENWPTIEKRFGKMSYKLSYIISSITHSHSTEKQLKELEAFAETTKDGSVARTALTRAAENVRTNIAWRNKNEANVIEWLRRHA